MSKRVVIISGGDITDELTLRSLLGKNIGVIGVDRGIEFLYRHKIIPNYIVGDFDSVSEEVARYYREETDVPIKEYNPVKDASDTEIAIRLAMTIGATEIEIHGATGGRLDHLWANVQCLYIPLKKDIKATLVDPQNRISLHDEDFVLNKEEAYGQYFSLFPLGEVVHGLTLEGAKYPLKNHTMEPQDSLCVSNEIKDEAVKVSFRTGTLILMETNDKEGF